MTIAATALITGVTPKRIIAYTLIGKVIDVGPELKNAITNSSIDNVKATRAPAITPGRIAGNVTSRNVVTGWAPRSAAASSMRRSK